MVWSTDADDAKILPDIPFPMNYVIIDQLALHLVDATDVIKIVAMLCKIGKINHQKALKFGL